MHDKIKQTTTAPLPIIVKTPDMEDTKILNPKSEYHVQMMKRSQQAGDELLVPQWLFKIITKPTVPKDQNNEVKGNMVDHTEKVHTFLYNPPFLIKKK